VTILETLVPSIFGVAFDGPTWDAWRACLKAIFGLAMTPAELAIFRASTGRETAPLEQAPEAWLAIGRRGGKSIIAADRRQARVVFRYITGLIDGCPMIAKLVVNRTAESIELANGIVLEVHTASFRSVRGYTIVAAVLDEVAFWRTDDSANPDREIVNALRPAMGTVQRALVIGISSPYSKHGVLWQAFKDHHGRDGDPVLVWRADSRTMNPLLPQSVVDAAMAEDETSARAEYLAEFRSDVDRLLPPEAVDACVIPGRLELPPVEGIRYAAFVDPSGGSADSMTLAVARAQAGGAVFDGVRGVRPPFSPDDVVAEFAATVKSYRCTSVTGDRYAGEWVRERFQRHGISYVAAEQVKSEIYLSAVPLLNAKRAELLDVPRLRVQLVGLERRTARGGRDTVDHGPGAHDDVSNSACGALVLAIGPAEPAFLHFLTNYPALGEAPAGAAPAPVPEPAPATWGRPLPAATDAQRAERRRRALGAFVAGGGWR